LIANNLNVKGLVVKLSEFNRIFTNCIQIGKQCTGFMDLWTLAERGLPVHGGVPVAAAERLTGVRPCGHSGGWELTEIWGKERGALRGSHRGLRGAVDCWR
jgi:hypothetical protein